MGRLHGPACVHDLPRSQNDPSARAGSQASPTANPPSAASRLLEPGETFLSPGIHGGEVPARKQVEAIGGEGEWA
jgi:hypothetical protein